MSYWETIFGQTILLRVIAAFFVLWLLFSAALLWAESNVPGSPIATYRDALYWSVAAFSTAGIAEVPQGELARVIGGVWIVVGSTIFFGTIVATVTAYFMRPMERPVNQIVETIEYNLEHLEDLSVDELALLKKTSDALIAHMEKIKARGDRAASADDA